MIQNLRIKKEFVMDEKVPYCEYLIFGEPTELLEHIKNTLKARQVRFSYLYDKSGFALSIHYCQSFCDIINEVDEMINKYVLRIYMQSFQ